MAQIFNGSTVENSNGFPLDVSSLENLPDQYNPNFLPETETMSTFKPIRHYNNMAIDDFYQQLIQQGNTISVGTFRNDLIQHEIRSRAEAKRQPQQPVIVNQILPGEESRFLNSFLKQPYGVSQNSMQNTTLAEIGLAKTATFNQTYSENQNFIDSIYNQNQEPYKAPVEDIENIRDVRAKKEMTSERSNRKKSKKTSKNDITVMTSNNLNATEKQKDSQLFIKDSELGKVINKSNPKVFLGIEIDNTSIGSIVIELFSHIVPKTAENFKLLCTGEQGFGYHMSYFHRIIPGFVCQGGDFEKSDGTGGHSIYGGEFEDENFSLYHTRPFLLSMANCGPNTNGSQFFITLIPCPHLDGKHVVFGQVIKGFNAVKKIEKCGTDSGEITREVKVVNCGLMD